MEIDLTTSYVGILSLIVFVLAYAVVMAEEFSHLRKSKPVIIAAALIWGILQLSSDEVFSNQRRMRRIPETQKCLRFFGDNKLLRKRGTQIPGA